jgi:hypothetical protein
MKVKERSGVQGAMWSHEGIELQKKEGETPKEH